MIYVIPSPLVDNEEFDLKEKTRGFVEVNAPNFWYLHGVLQDKFNFDKAYMFVDFGTIKTESIQTINNRNYLAPGIYNNIVVEKYDKPCKGYFWHEKYSGEKSDLRGVIIDPTNKQDLKYAEKLYKEKPFAF